MTRSIVALVCLLLWQSAAQAAVLPNRTSWEKLPLDEKEWYLAGWIDHESMITGGPGIEYKALTEGLTECFHDLMPAGGDMIKVVDYGYARNPSYAAMTPGLVFNNESAALCRDHVNKARAVHKLPPL